jgi:hypothetical protein
VLYIEYGSTPVPPHCELFRIVFNFCLSIPYCSLLVALFVLGDDGFAPSIVELHEFIVLLGCAFDVAVLSLHAVSHHLLIQDIRSLFGFAIF